MKKKCIKRNNQISKRLPQDKKIMGKLTCEKMI